MCTDLGLLSVEEQHLVTGVAVPLPANDAPAKAVSEAELDQGNDDSITDNEAMFMTPRPRQHSSNASSPPRDNCARSHELLRMHSTRQKRRFPSSQAKTSKKQKNTIFNCYSSQK